MDQEMRNSDDDTAWPQLAADLNLSRANSRSITLDTHRASEDGRILEVGAQLDLMRTRLASLERHVFDASTAGGVPDDLADRLSRLDDDIASTGSGFEGLAARVAATEEHLATSLLTSVEGFDSRISVVEDARLSQTSELNELTGYLEQAFTRIAELAALIEDERGTNAASRSESFNQISDFGSQVDGKVDDLDRAIAELNARVDSAASSIDESTAVVNSVIEASLAELEGRVTASEAKLDTVDEVSTSIQFLTARADALEAAQVNTADGIIAHVDSAHGRIDETESQIIELRTQIDTPDNTLSSTVDQVAKIDGEINEIKTVVEGQAAILEENMLQNDAAVQNHEERIAANEALLADQINTDDDATLASAEHLASIEASTDGHATILETHSEILDATTGLLGEHSGLLAESQEHLAQLDAKQVETTDALAQHELAQAKTAEALASTADTLAQHEAAQIAAAEAVAHTSDMLAQHEAALAQTAEAVAQQNGALAETEEALASYEAAQAETAETLASYVEQMSEHDAAVANALSSANEANTAAHDASDRISNIAENAELLGQRIDLVDSATTEFQAQVDTNRNALDVSSEQIQALDVAVAGLNEQITNAATALDAANERIDQTESSVFDATSKVDAQRAETQSLVDGKASELHGRIDSAFHKIDELTEHVTVDEPNAEVVELTGRVDDVNARVDAITEDTHNTANRIDDTTSKLGEIHHRIDHEFQHAHDRIGAAHERVDSLEQHVASLEDERNAAPDEPTETVLPEAFLGVQDQMSDVRDIIRSNTDRVDVAEHKVAELGGHQAQLVESVQSLETETSELATRLADALEQSETESIDPALLSDFHERIASVEARSGESMSHFATVEQNIALLEARFEEQKSVAPDTEETGHSNERIEALELTVTQAEASASEAKAFSENLRVLQTDLVQAIQSEMHTQSRELEQHAAHIGELKSAGDFASAERVQMLEAKIVEALQTISQLTQLQRRNTTVETQLTDTLTATSQGVEHTQQHVIALRGELEAALGRIGQLEAAISTLSAAPVAAATPVAVAAAQPPVAEATAAPAAEVEAEAEVPPSDEPTDETDTGWFTESYARKNAS